MSGKNIKYEMQVTGIGELTDEFTAEGILVFFGEGAPEELLDFAIIHTHTDLKEPVAPGDEIVFEGQSFKVTAVGEVANENLSNLGHLVMKTTGETEAELPGDVCVEAKPLPEITVGMKITIIAGS
jgi:PTS system glucitol/sorbitol-specific IIA component